MSISGGGDDVDVVVAARPGRSTRAGRRGAPRRGRRPRRAASRGCAGAPCRGGTRGCCTSRAILRKAASTAFSNSCSSTSTESLTLLPSRGSTDVFTAGECTGRRASGLTGTRGTGRTTQDAGPEGLITRADHDDRTGTPTATFQVHPISEPSAAPPRRRAGGAHRRGCGRPHHPGQPVDGHPTRSGQVGRGHRGQGERHGAVARHEPQPVVRRSWSGDVAGDLRGRAAPLDDRLHELGRLPRAQADHQRADRRAPSAPRHPGRRGDGRRRQRAAELHR